MTLKTLKLTNFEGIKSLTIKPGGKSMSIYGDNGTGKTTIANAQAWLLFDKDSDLTPNFTPKMRDENGEEIHNTECSVAAVYEINGADVTLEKTMTENWKKKRGSTKAVFSGHNVTYHIDGVPKKEKEYNEFLNSIADMQTLMLLTMPRYFPEVLDIKKRRAMLMSLTPDLTDFDVIGSCKELEPLLHLMLKPGSTQLWYSIDEFREICRSEASKANAELKEIPGRIDEAARALCDMSGEEIQSLELQLKELNAKKTSLQMSAVSSQSDRILEIRSDISSKSAELEEKRAAWSKKNSTANEAVMQRLDSLMRELAELRQKKCDLSVLIADSERKLSELDRQRSRQLERWEQVSLRSWQGDTVCPVCHRPVPQEQIAQAKAEFEAKRAAELEELNAYGREHCSKAMIAELKGCIEDHLKNSEQLDVKMTEAAKAVDNAKAQLVTTEPFESTDEYKQAMNEIEGLKAQITVLEKGDKDRNKKLYEEIAVLDNEIADIGVKLAGRENDKRARERIAELESRQKQLGEVYAKALQGTELCELFCRTKARLLTEKINLKFNNVRFRLFRTQINGGIADDCEVMALTTSGYIPYSTANNAAGINAGLEIIRTFGREKGISAPVFVDNAESVTRLSADGLQVIRLAVSDKDKKLRFETEE